jgi:hypothetical protein
MTTTESTALTHASNQGLGVAAITLAITTPIAAVIGWIWAAATPGAASLSVAVLALVAVSIIAALAVIVGIVSLVLSKPNSLAKLSLILVAATGIVLFLLVAPPSTWNL